MITKRLFFRTISPTQEKILTQLARYKFLTSGQMLRLGIMTDRANLNKQISELRSWSKSLIGSVTFGTSPRFWKLESVHHLTSYGANLIKERLHFDDPVRFPKGKGVLFQQDYLHRISTVDVHIALQEQSSQNNWELLFFLAYFDKGTSTKKRGYKAESTIPISRNEHLIADALCMLETPKRKELYAVEVFNGNDTNRVHKSLLQHLKALSVGQPSKMFGLSHGSRILCVFETENGKLNVMKRLNEDKCFTEARLHFLFKTIGEVRVNVFEGWMLFDGESINMF